MATSVPSPSFTPTGFSAPSEAVILPARQADLDAAFGVTLNKNLNTPQGQIASTETAIIGDRNNQFLELVNLVDPAFSMGRFQDGIGRIYYQTRNPAVATVVSCVVIGAGGTVIPAGTLAKDFAGNIYAAVQTSIIAGSTVVTSMDFANITTGAIPCAANTLTQIYTTIPGWDSINNPADGVLGNAEETPQQFEARRRQSVAQNANGTIPAIRGAVLSVPGVVDAYVTDNTASSAATIGGVTIPAYGLYVAVSGGSDGDVARAIWTKKQPGGPYYTGSGVTTVSVLDNRSNYATPPVYPVSFQRAAALAIKFQITLTNNRFVPSDAQAQIAAAIVSAMAGGDGGPRSTIGSIVYASRYYAPVAKLGTWPQIVSIKVSLDGSTWSDDVTATIAQIPTVAATDISLVLQ